MCLGWGQRLHEEEDDGVGGVAGRGKDYFLVAVGRLMKSKETSWGRRALLGSGEVESVVVGGSEGRRGGAHREECSCSGSCSCSQAAALPGAGASFLPPAFADSER